MDSTDERLAYVTLLSTEDYFEGVLALNESLQRVKSQHRLWAVLGNKVGQSAEAALDKAGIGIIRPERSVSLSPEVSARNVETGRSHWNATFDKLSVFSLVQFSKLVYLDSDMLVLRNLDHLFEAPHLSAVVAGRSYPGHGDWAELNSGLMVLVPQADLFSRLVDLLPVAAGKKDNGSDAPIGDQDVLHCMFPEWKERPALHLQESYNIFVMYLDFYVRHLGYSWEGEAGFHVLHFIGKTKPWMYGKAQRLRWYLRLLCRGRIHELRALMLHATVLSAAKRKLAGH